MYFCWSTVVTIFQDVTDTDDAASDITQLSIETDDENKSGTTESSLP